MKERNRKVQKGTKLYYANYDDDCCRFWVIALVDFEIENNESVGVLCNCAETDGSNKVFQSCHLYELVPHLRFDEHEVFLENNEDLDYPYICWDLDENCYTFECHEVDI